MSGGLQVAELGRRDEPDLVCNVANRQAWRARDFAKSLTGWGENLLQVPLREISRLATCPLHLVEKLNHFATIIRRFAFRLDPTM